MSLLMIREAKRRGVKHVVVKHTMPLARRGDSKYLSARGRFTRV